MIQLLEKGSSISLETHFAFIGLQKAYDPVSKSGLWENLKHSRDPNGPINIIKKLYNDNNAQIESGGKLSLKILVIKGHTQGCSLSQLQFNAYLEGVLRQQKRFCESGWLLNKTLTISISSQRLFKAYDQNSRKNLDRSEYLVVNTDASFMIMFGNKGQL